MSCRGLGIKIPGENKLDGYLPAFVFLRALAHPHPMSGLPAATGYPINRICVRRYLLIQNDVIGDTERLD
jgi:hypothetical protein